MKVRFLVWLLLLCGLQCGVLRANVIDVTGRVLDDAGSPLAGAHVRIPNQKLSAVTDPNGCFRLTVKEKGVVRVQVSYIGFQTETFVLNTGTRRDEHVLRLTPDVAALEQVVVTATRTPKALKEVPVVTRLITPADIRKADATNVQDLLTEELPGLEFGYAMSQETSLNMSGFGGNAVLFLVDGERLAGETMDNVDYNRLNLDNVARIEVVKGAASALYGANAVAGVVNIITRESSEPWTANLNSRYRDMGKEWRHGGTFSFNSGKWNSQTNVQHTTMETVDLTGAFDTQSRIQKVFGGKTLNLKERLVFKATDKLKLIARGGYFKRESNRSNYDDHYKDYNGGLKAVYDFSKEQNLEVSYGYDQYDKLRFVGGSRTHDHDYTNRQHIVHALYSRQFGQNMLTVGGDYLNDYLSTYQFRDNEAHRQYTADAFAQFDYNPLRWLNVVASLRHDYFSSSKSGALTARLATMFKWKGFSVRANYAGGFRAPTLKEMYMHFDMAGIQMIYGNPDLKPEKSHNFNLALEHSGHVRGGNLLTGQYSLTLMGYSNKYEKRITLAEFPGDATREKGAIYANDKGVVASGLDFSAQYRTDYGFGLKLNYNYLRTTGRTVDSQFSQPRPHSATWRIDFDRQLCSVYGLNVALSGRYLSTPDTRQKEFDKAYQLWKFSLQQRIWKGISLNCIIDNLFAYKPSVYYWNSAPTAGRTWSVGVSLDIDRMVSGL
ncbi:outer membrane receptor for ferrienterochelin and colicins [Bacteroides zoogleoformans]|uniref:TonB-dependent receptor n=1 Tax=Bacteroides zoogleoformans TaxID=28119 RepID=A0ABM6T7N6_9BACE|nr:TonB-dependent receptor [Bacteroides zoogleoformans]AVM52610.1 TonB-dependent receptor [Bacteroides zoogleoformans]TWJ17721.1 outer membrane receptor for ferrienterochelin and colicins [Bacteroides zoogleoformans]